MKTQTQLPDLFVMRFGEVKSKKVIIILHGWGQKGEYWYEIGNALADKSQVHVIDLPGFGKSKAFDTIATTANYADLILDYIRENKLQNITLIGHSFGGQVAIKMEKKSPELFEKLVLIAPAFIKDKMVVTGAKVTEYFAKVKEKQPRAEKIVQPIFTSPEYTKAAVILKKLLKQAGNPYYKRELKQITTPTLLVWGETENVLPHDPQVIADNITDCKLEIIKGADHNLHMTHKTSLLKIVEQFVRL